MRRIRRTEDHTTLLYTSISGAFGTRCGNSKLEAFLASNLDPSPHRAWAYEEVIAMWKAKWRKTQA